MTRALGLFAALALVIGAVAADPGDGTEPAPQSSSFMTALAPLLVKFIESSRDFVEKVTRVIARIREELPEACRYGHT